MVKTRKLEVFKMINGESLGEMVFEVNAYGHPICPTCGLVMEYWEGQIDQDYMGNDIDGWCHECEHCGIHTATMEGNGGYDHE